MPISKNHATQTQKKEMLNIEYTSSDDWDKIITFWFVGETRRGIGSRQRNMLEYMLAHETGCASVYLVNKYLQKPIKGLKHYNKFAMREKFYPTIINELIFWTVNTHLKENGIQS